MSDLDPRIPVRRFLEDALNTPDLDLLEELFAQDFVWHGSGGAGDVHGQAAFKALFPPFLAAFPNLFTRIDELLVSGDKVTARFTCTATHKGQFMGIPATGRDVSWTGINVYQVQNGRIVEEWSCEDTWSILSHLGVTPT